MCLEVAAGNGKRYERAGVGLNVNGDYERGPEGGRDGEAGGVRAGGAG
jgi:hypothetical protein